MEGDDALLMLIQHGSDSFIHSWMPSVVPMQGHVSITYQTKEEVRMFTLHGKKGHLNTIFSHYSKPEIEITHRESVTTSKVHGLPIC